MLMITEHTDLVKRQVEYYVHMCERSAERVRLHANTQNAERSADKLATYERLLRSFERLYQAMQTDIDGHNNCAPIVDTSALSSEGNDAYLAKLLSKPTSIDPGNLDGLPAELIEQLQISDSDRFQWDVIGLIDRTPDKTISIEVLLIALFHKTKKVYDRTDLSNRIYRLGRKGVLFGVPGKKGWYTTIPQNGELDLVPPNGGEEES